MNSDSIYQHLVYSFIIVVYSVDIATHALGTVVLKLGRLYSFPPSIGQQFSIKMLPPQRSSTAWNYDNRFYPESEHDNNESIKRVRNDWKMTGENPVLQYPPPNWLQRHSEYRKLQQAMFLLLSLTMLYYIYLGDFLPCKFKDSNSQDQTPILHFSTPTGTQSGPIGLFLDDNKTWHIYFQC
jgi:hypothetical protein